MAARRRERGAKRGPVKLTPQVIDVLELAVNRGIPMQIAAAGAGVSVGSFENWLAVGRKEYEAREEGLPASPALDTQVELFERILKARADAAGRNVLLIQKAAQGGAIVEESKEELPDGTIRTTVRRAAPDWRASAWYLERQYRPQFGREAIQVEFPGGEPGQAAVGAGSGSGVDTAALAAKITENLAAITAGGPAPEPADDVVDVEVIEDEATG